MDIYQHRVAAGLGRQVDLAAQGGHIGKAGDQFIRHILGMGCHEAYAPDPVYGIHLADQLGKGRFPRPVLADRAPFVAARGGRLCFMPTPSGSHAVAKAEFSDRSLTFGLGQGEYCVSVLTVEGQRTIFSTWASSRRERAAKSIRYSIDVIVQFFGPQEAGVTSLVLNRRSLLDLFETEDCDVARLGVFHT